MRKEKQLLLDDIENMIKDSGSFIITDYHELTPNLSWEFRNELRKNNATFEAVKKRIFIKAIKNIGIDCSIEELKGHIGIVLADGDGIDATKSVFDFTKANKGFLDVLCGYFENRIYSSEEVKQLSKLPGKEEMRAQFLGLLEAPMSQTLAVIESLLTSVIHCLENKSQKDTQ